MEVKHFELAEREDYKAFLHRILAKWPQEQVAKISAMLELIITELHDRTYSLTASVNNNEIEFVFIHQGKLLDKMMLHIIDDLFDKTRYHQEDRNHHKLTLKIII